MEQLNQSFHGMAFYLQNKSYNNDTIAPKHTLINTDNINNNNKSIIWQE